MSDAIIVFYSDVWHSVKMLHMSQNVSRHILFVTFSVRILDYTWWKFPGRTKANSYLWRALLICDVIHLLVECGSHTHTHTHNTHMHIHIHIHARLKRQRAPHSTLASLVFLFWIFWFPFPYTLWPWPWLNVTFFSALQVQRLLYKVLFIYLYTWN